jgi:hypothetical protein
MADAPEATIPTTPDLRRDLARSLRHAASTMHANLGAVLILASIVVLLPTILLTLLERLIEARDATTGSIVVGVLLAVVVAALGTVGGTFLAGVLDKLVGSHLHGHPFEGLAHIFRTLPWGRLIIADLLVSMVVAISTALFVLPGLVAYTLFALVGPIIVIEDRTTKGAFRRSVQLVWRSFLLVFFSVTAVLVLEVALELGFEAWLEQALGESLHHLTLAQHLLSALAIDFVFGVVVGSYAALLKVCVAYELIARDEGASPA